MCLRTNCRLVNVSLDEQTSIVSFYLYLPLQELCIAVPTLFRVSCHLVMLLGLTILWG